MTNHKNWAKDIEETQGYKVNYPMIGDTDLKIAKLYDMLPEEAGTTAEGRTPADNATVRAVFIIGPDKKIKATLTYPMGTGRNFDEVLRLLDSLQVSAKYSVSTPVNWKPGEDVVVPASMPDDQVKQKFPGGLKVAEALPAHGRATEGLTNSRPSCPRKAGIHDFTRDQRRTWIPAFAGMTVISVAAQCATARRSLLT